MLTYYKQRPNQCEQNQQSGEINVYNIFFTFYRSLYVHFSITKMYVHCHSCFLLCTNYYIRRCTHSASSNCLSVSLALLTDFKLRKLKTGRFFIFVLVHILFSLPKQRHSFFLIKLFFIIFWFVGLREECWSLSSTFGSISYLMSSLYEWCAGNQSMSFPACVIIWLLLWDKADNTDQSLPLSDENSTDVPQQMEKVKKRDWMLKYSVILRYYCFTLELFCDTEKGSVSVKRWATFLLFLKLLIISQNLIYNLIKGTRWLQNTQQQQHLWEDNGKKCLFMLSVLRYLLGQKAANQDILSLSDCLSIFMPFSTDEGKPDPNQICELSSLVFFKHC